jgi:hypothetical protein
MIYPKLINLNINKQNKTEYRIKNQLKMFLKCEKKVIFEDLSERFGWSLHEGSHVEPPNCLQL